MSVFTPASEVILRNEDEFSSRRILFAGDLQDTLPAQLHAADIRVHASQYHQWQALNQTLGERCRFGLLATADLVADCDTLVYYWPKNKSEAQFQLMQLFSLLPVGVEFFIVGENRAGVRSAETLVEKYSPLVKIDSARRCGLYHGRLEKQPNFSLSEWWQHYTTGSLTIATLPGVFSRDALDIGSHLLLSSLEAHMKGKVLDVGCGAGVLAAAIAKMSPKVKLTLCDVSAAALAASQETLRINGIEGEIVASNVYSALQGRFDMIISNPPFHDGLQTSLHATETLIRGASRHLQIGGELRIVANAFLPYPDMLDAVFGNHEIVAQTGRFKVYRAVLGRSAPGLTMR